jgi:hydroxymethylglutaryl-CoA lyase
MKEIAIFTSASERFSLKNTNCSIEESLERLRTVSRAAKNKNIRIRGYVSCIAKCPYEGAVDPDHVVKVTTELLNMGCYEVSLGDTIGAATPGNEVYQSNLLHLYFSTRRY